MSGLPWIKLEHSLPDHPKLLELSALLGDPDKAFACVVRLWSWMSRCAPTGIVRGPKTVEIIETAARWRGEAGLFHASALACRLLDHVRDGVAIHNWEQHQGAHIEKAARDRARKREHRDTFRGQGADVPRTGRGAARVEERRGEERRTTAVSGEEKILSPGAQFLVRYGELTAKFLNPSESERRALEAEVLRLGVERAVTEANAAARQAVTRNGRWPGVRYLLTVLGNVAPKNGVTHTSSPRREERVNMATGIVEVKGDDGEWRPRDV